ncbi:MAG TPA: cytochrome c, partial [Nevskiaceae bacterium]|nr:cytochrome c [Nevskiaceae bacterium]
AALARGAGLYKKNCSDCHGEDGRGQPPDEPPLAGNAMLTAPDPGNAILMVLQGGYAPGTRGNPRPYGMPPYAQALSEEDIAALLSYARQAWGNAAAPVDAQQVARVRGIPQE